MSAPLLRERGRITARVPKNVEKKLQTAADLTGATMNQFVVKAALREAERVMEAERRIRLTVADADLLFGLMEKPFRPNARLKRALARYWERRSNEGLAHRAPRQNARSQPVRLRRRSA